MTPPSDSSSSAPLAGVLVVDMTTSYAGPTAAMYLADLGASVVKVERPGTGDDCRGWGPPFIDGVSAWFASANRNKRSVVVDLRHEEGREVLHRLLRHADVFLHNTNPSKLARMAIDPGSVRAHNPALIYCAVSGFGLDGPDSDLPGYDLVAQARSGLMSVTGEKGGAPQRVSTALSDIITGMAAAIAVNASLVRRAREGEGEVIDVSLLDTDLALMAPRIAAFHAGEPEPAPSGGTDSVLALYQGFDTADRRIVVAVGNDAMWRRFCAVVGLHDLADEPAFADNAGRRKHGDRIRARVSEALLARPAAEWLQLLADAAVPASVVQTLSEVVSDRQVVARGSLLPVPDTDGALVTVRSPFRLGSQPEPRNEPAPALAAHTAEVLAELGFSAEEIRRLASRGAVQLSSHEDVEEAVS